MKKTLRLSAVLTCIALLTACYGDNETTLVGGIDGSFVTDVEAPNNDNIIDQSGGNTADTAPSTVTSTPVDTTQPDPTSVVMPETVAVPLIAFSQLYKKAEEAGECSVRTETIANNTYFIPSGGAGRYHILGWGNGTSTATGMYSLMLKGIASHCILVAASNTTSAGTGSPITSAVELAQVNYASILAPDTTICTSGHSQGGGGSINAASQIANASCVIPLQPDTIVTSRVGPLPDHVDVITIYGEDDFLASRIANESRVREVTTSYVGVEVADAGHLVMYANEGGSTGTMMRMASMAFLSPDLSTRNDFRTAFFGSESIATVTTDHPSVSYVERSLVPVAMKAAIYELY